MQDEMMPLGFTISDHQFLSLFELELEHRVGGGK